MNYNYNQPLDDNAMIYPVLGGVWSLNHVHFLVSIHSFRIPGNGMDVDGYDLWCPTLGLQLPASEVLNGTWQHGQPVVPFVSRCHACHGSGQHPGCFFSEAHRGIFWGLNHDPIEGVSSALSSLRCFGSGAISRGPFGGEGSGVSCFCRESDDLWARPNLAACSFPQQSILMAGIAWLN